MRRMCLCCPTMKRKEIIARIHDYPNQQMNFDPKKWQKVRLSYETKASIHFPNEENEFVARND